MQLPKGVGSYYQVTVAGNNDSLMYLAYNGKTSVVPFHRLAKLPDDGDGTLRLLESMKMSNFKMSDLTGYWVSVAEDGTTSNDGIYIDAEGNISYVEIMQQIIQYHADKVTLNAYLCTIPYQGTDHELYGVNDTTMLIVDKGEKKVDRLVRKEVPQEMMRAEKIATSKVPNWLTGTWEAVHYKTVYGGNTSDDFDINESEWTKQFYRKLVFSSDHQLKQGGHSDISDLAFYVDNDKVYYASSMNDLINNPIYHAERSWTIVSHSDDELVLKYSWSDNYEIYTYKRKQ